MSHPRGFVTIASLLVISVLITLIGTTVSILGIDEAVTSLSVKKGWETLDFVGGCAEEALLKINESGSIPAVVNLPQGSCSVTEATSSGAIYQFVITGTQGNHSRSLYLEFDRAVVPKVNYWQER